MKFEINRLTINSAIASALLVARLQALAMTGDTEQPIHIVSDKQRIDIRANVVTFTGNVIVTQGDVRINADKVILTRSRGEQGKEIIDGYGNQATFYKVQNNGKPVKGRATHLHYELPKDLLILTGNAYLEQLDSNISGDKITYLVKEQEMHAYSKKSRRVTTVLFPSKLQN